MGALQAETHTHYDRNVAREELRKLVGEKLAQAAQDRLLAEANGAAGTDDKVNMKGLRKFVGDKLILAAQENKLAEAIEASGNEDCIEHSQHVASLALLRACKDRT